MLNSYDANETGIALMQFRMPINPRGPVLAPPEEAIADFHHNDRLRSREPSTTDSYCIELGALEDNDDNRATVNADEWDLIKFARMLRIQIPRGPDQSDEFRLNSPGIWTGCPLKGASFNLVAPNSLPALVHTNAQQRKTSMHAAKLVVISSHHEWIHFTDAWRAAVNMAWGLLADVTHIDSACAPAPNDLLVDHAWLASSNVPKKILDITTCMASEGNVSSVTAIDLLHNCGYHPDESLLQRHIWSSGIILPQD